MDTFNSGLSDRSGGIPPDLVMTNNNYLPGTVPYNGLVGTIQSDREMRRTVPAADVNIRPTSAIGAGSTASVPTPMHGVRNNIWQNTGATGAIGGQFYLPPNCQGCANNNGPSFTFTSPTQSCLNSPALMSQPRFQGPRTISHTFSPTGQTQWQHSLPQRLPWTSVGMTTQSGIPVFTGSSNSTIPCSTICSRTVCPTSSTIMRDPVPSCSEEPRRPKRHSSDNLQHLGPSTKIHLTEEKFAKHMEGLSIQCLGTPEDGSFSNGLPQLKLSPDVVPKEFAGTCPSFIQTSYSPSPGQEPESSNMEEMQGPEPELQKRWKAFHELENRLELSDEEEEDCIKGRGRSRGKSLPVVHLTKPIDQLVASPSILPPNILEDIQRPKMEMMLWKPPEEAVKDATSSASQPPLLKCHTADARDTSFPDNEADMDEDDCMDTEQIDCAEL